MQVYPLKKPKELRNFQKGRAMAFGHLDFAVVLAKGDVQKESNDFKFS
jgi:hypothetical protein